MKQRLNIAQVAAVSRLTTATMNLSVWNIAHRVAVTAAHEAELSVREIATVAGVSPQTVQRMIEADRESGQKGSAE